MKFRNVAYGSLALLLSTSVVVFTMPHAAHATSNYQVFSSLSTLMRQTGTTFDLDAQTNASSNIYPMPTTGTFGTFRAYVDHAPGSGASWTATLRKNGTNTSVTCTISNTNTSCADTTDTVTNAVGDRFDISWTISGLPALSTLFASVQFTPDTAGQDVLLGNATTNASLNDYGALNADGNSTSESAVQQYIPEAGTLENMYILLGADPRQTYNFSIRQNAATSSVTCAIVSPATTCNDTTHTASISSGDLFNNVIAPSGIVTQRSGGMGTVYVPNTSGDFLLMSTLNIGAVGTTRYMAFGTSMPAPLTTEASSTVYTDTMTVKELDVRNSTAPGAGKSITFNTRKNGATVQTCTISNSAQTCQDTTQFTTAPGDTIDMQIVPSASISLIPTIVLVANSNPGGAAAGTPARLNIVQGQFIIRNGQMIIQ